MKNPIKIKRLKKERRRKRVRAKIFGTSERPRLSVFRSHKHIYCQIINDEKGKTLVSASDFELKSEERKNIKKDERRKVAIAFKVGELIAKKALEKGIEKVVFDRDGYKYHGRVKALAEGARSGGLKF
jgi:large subunit ribosomal protein L18